MKEGLLDRIRSVGHWRVNFRPFSAPGTRLLLGQCREIVEKSSISVRGWDFPHISRGYGDEGGYSNEAEYVENWTDWYGFNEFWRMYPSTQFLSYVVLREDTMPADYGNPRVRILSTPEAIFQITEFIEFCHRLCKSGLYKEGVYAHLALINTKNRILVTGPRQIPFFDRMETNAERIDLRMHLDAERLSEDHRTIAVELCIQLFDRFGWNPDGTQLQAVQERFYRQDWR